MKKISILLAILLIATFSVFALGSGESDNSTTDQGGGSAETTSTPEAAETTAVDNSSLGDYSVVIDSCRLAKDYEGKDIVIVKYVFTNVSDDNAAAFYMTFDDVVYQDGVGLNEAYILSDSANYSSDNQTKEIKKGATLEVEVAYELNDTVTNIDVEVSEIFSFDDKTITKTFTIAQ